MKPVEQAGDHVRLMGAVGVLADRFAAALQEGRWVGVRYGVSVVGEDRQGVEAAA